MENRYLRLHVQGFLKRSRPSHKINIRMINDKFSSYFSNICKSCRTHYPTLMTKLWYCLNHEGWMISLVPIFPRKVCNSCILHPTIMTKLWCCLNFKSWRMHPTRFKHLAPMSCKGKLGTSRQVVGKYLHSEVRSVSSSTYLPIICLCYW